MNTISAYEPNHVDIVDWEISNGFQQNNVGARSAQSRISITPTVLQWMAEHRYSNHMPKYVMMHICTTSWVGPTHALLTEEKQQSPQRNL